VGGSGYHVGLPGVCGRRKLFTNDQTRGRLGTVQQFSDWRGPPTLVYTSPERDSSPPGTVKFSATERLRVLETDDTPDGAEHLERPLRHGMDFGPGDPQLRDD